MAKILEIRNSTAEFLTFLAENKEDGVQVVYCGETIWATQVAMGELFDVSPKTINEHLSNIYKEGELVKEATIRKFQIVQLEGTRQVNREPRTGQSVSTSSSKPVVMRYCMMQVA